MFFVGNEDSILLLKLFFYYYPIFGEYKMMETEYLNQKVKYHYLLIIPFIYGCSFVAKYIWQTHFMLIGVSF